MIDRSSADYGQMLRTPDLRLTEVRTRLVQGAAARELRIDDPGRSLFIYAVHGDFTLEIEGAGRPPIDAPQGTSAGFESGRAHVWRCPGDDAAAAPPILFVSSIPRRLGVLQRLDDGLIIVPATAEPYAGIIRHAVGMHLLEATRAADDDDSVVRRCAEICLIQFVRYARARIAAQPDTPPGLMHDEYLLRAWSAYFADPGRRWTVHHLAAAAGLGRSSFAERFHRVFGAPPLRTITALRLKQAEGMLRHGHAPLLKIAFSVGYRSEAAFVRAFHRNYGMPPGRFRQVHGA